MTDTIDGFLLRTPLLPVSAFTDLVSGLPDAEWSEAEGFARGIAVVRERVRALVTAADIGEALFIASPALVDSLPVWLTAPLSQRGQKVERSLVKYLARMSTRPTPFGLFSGCSTGVMGDRTELTAGARSRVHRHSRLDMDYLFALTETLNRSPDFRARLLFRPNDTMVSLGSRYRYVEPRLRKDHTRQYHLVAVERTPDLDVVLRASASGASVETLAAALLQHDPALTAEEVHAYVDELIDGHVLISTLQPPATGHEPAGEIAGQLRALGADEIAASLDSAVARLACLDASGVGNPATEYLAIFETLKALPAPVEISRLVQVDMCKRGVAALGPLVRAEVERCCEALAQFGRPADGLASFRTAFEKRYGTAAVPLLQALDEESGIGLGETTPSDQSPLIAGLPVGNRRDGQEWSWKPQHGWLLDQLHAAWTAHAAELVIADDDLRRFYASSASTARCPDAFSVGFTLVAASADAVDRGDFLLEFRGAGGPSGARILGRFCHVDEDIAALVGRHLREEEAQDPDAVFAEIVHLPHGRLGNVILRPVLRQYELTYLGRSGAPDDQQIPLSDLWVTVRAGRILVWSARLGRRVVPRLTKAHNFMQPGTLTPYRFLALLQMDGLRAGFAWDWGPLANTVYLPRVRWGRCVLSRASWHATRDELRPLAKLRGHERFAAARAWAHRRRMPRLVELVDGDNELLVDFDNPLSVEAFIDLVKDRQDIRLSEMFPTPADLCVSGPEGAFTHEICMPIVRRRDAQPAPEPSWSLGIPAHGDLLSRRNRAPGAEWLFVKIYAGAAEIDRVLSTVVAPLVDDAIGEGLADRWFFVRYADPDYHLRLRFRGIPRRLHGELLVRLHEGLEPFVASGNVSRVQLDTYQPEIERYGGAVGIDLSEQIFQADSEAVLSLLCELEGDAGAEARWQVALRGLDAMMQDLGLSGQEQRDFVARRRRDYGLELNVDATPVRHLLGDRFRQSRKVLESLWDPSQDDASELALGFQIWKRRSRALRPLADRLRAAETEGRLAVPVGILADSYLHMYVNRVARAYGRTHELVMFDFLNRHLGSLAARRAASPTAVRP